MFGEFGGNDYNAALFSGRTMAEVRGYVPKVVSKLIRGLEVLDHSDLRIFSGWWLCFGH